MPVLPVRPGGKEPLCRHGCRDASSDPAQIESWWRTWPNANIGIATGGASGLVVVDIDLKPGGPDGEASFREIERAVGRLPDTWEARTGGGGRHIWFRVSPGASIRSAVHRLPGIDVRADGGYVVAPPSRHASGARYAWIEGHHPDESPIAALPIALGRFLADRDRLVQPHAAGAPAPIGEGSRNATLTKLAGSMRRPGMTEDAMLAALLVENHLRCTPPLSDTEVRKIVRSIMKYPPATVGRPSALPVTGLVSTLRVVALSDVPESRPMWLWSGRIPFGYLSLLEGPPDVGKTTLALAIAAAVTTGRPLPGGPGAIPPSHVVVFSAEDSAGATLRPRAAAQGADLSRLHVLAPSECDRLPTLPTDVPEIGRLVDELGARLVVIDPLMAFFSPDVDAHRDQDTRRALFPLTVVAQRTGCAIVLIRHLTKDTSRPAISRGAGSMGIIGAARSALGVARDDRDPSTFIIASVKSNLSRHPTSLRYRLEQTDAGEYARLVWSGDADVDADSLGDAEQERSALQEAVAFLRTELADGPKAGKLVQAQAREAGISEATLRRGRLILGVKPRRSGFKDGRWMWQLPEDAQGQTVSIFANEPAPKET